MTKRRMCATPRCGSLATPKRPTCYRCQHAALLLLRAEIHALRDQGMLEREIAARVGVTKGCAHRHLTLPDTRPDIPPLTPRQLGKVYRLCSEGYAADGIATKTGYPAFQVREVLEAPEAQDEMYGLLDGRWKPSPTNPLVRVWVDAGVAA